MTHCLWLVIIGVVVLLPADGETSQIVLDQRENGLWHRFVKIDTNSPSLNLLKKLAAPMIEETSASVRRLVVASNLEILLDASHRYVLRDVGEEVLLKRRRMASRTGEYIMEVVCLAGDCVQRSKDRHGQLRGKVLSGSNPLVLTVEAKTVSLVYLEVSPVNRYVNVFARITNGSLDSASLVFSKIIARMGGLNVGLELRDDTWPFGSEQIPADFFLWNETLPLDVAEYRKVPFVLCSAWPAPQMQQCRVWSYGSPRKPE